MRIHYKRRRTTHKFDQIKYRFNDRIHVPEVRVIDDEQKMLGILPTEKALQIAQEKGLDLVEVSPKANPPVCKILDYGAFKYQKEKEIRQQKAHAKKVEVKGIRLSVKIGSGDLETRYKKALDFLEAGQKLKIEIILRGREKAHANLAMDRIKDFITELEKKYELFIEQPPKRQGGNISAIVGRKN